jgi:hypothetical protein
VADVGVEVLGDVVDRVELVERPAGRERDRLGEAARHLVEEVHGGRYGIGDRRVQLPARELDHLLPPIAPASS